MVGSNLPESISDLSDFEISFQGEDKLSCVHDCL